MPILRISMLTQALLLGPNISQCCNLILRNFKIYAGDSASSLLSHFPLSIILDTDAMCYISQDYDKD